MTNGNSPPKNGTNIPKKKTATNTTSTPQKTRTQQQLEEPDDPIPSALF
ncbi:MAG: hypothetical protein IKS59_00270 [Aeriscardovia sp.]|nr:hypothetical protein [Aeriscardovia sp.]